MEIYLSPKGILSGAELNELFSTNGWQVGDSNVLGYSVKNSWHWITARNESGNLVGFVQAISEGIRHVYILKLIVHPDFRHQGIATSIMNNLMEIIHDNKMLPTLVATPGNVKFYEQFGFRTELKGLTAMCVR